MVLAQNGITIKLGYKYRVHDKLHSGLCPVKTRSLVTEIRVVLSEPGPHLPIALIIDDSFVRYFVCNYLLRGLRVAVNVMLAIFRG